MIVVVVGGTGTIGKAVINELSPRHEIVCVGHKRGDLLCDMSSTESILEMYENIGSFDALVVVAGGLVFDDFTNMTYNKYMSGIKNKLMGQVDLVINGLNYISDGGSFTLTSGILSQEPIAKCVSASMVNSAVDRFVKGASIDMPRGIRINSVSPTILEETVPKFPDLFRGYKPVPSSEVALAYSRSVEGKQTGRVYSAGY